MRYIAPPNPIAHFPRSIPAEEKSNSLTFVPCMNGIVKVSDEVFDDNNRKCRISSLVYRFRDCCAVAKLIRLDNESISTKFLFVFSALPMKATRRTTTRTFSLNYLSKHQMLICYSSCCQRSNVELVWTARRSQHSCQMSFLSKTSS